MGPLDCSRLAFCRDRLLWPARTLWLILVLALLIGGAAASGQEPATLNVQQALVDLPSVKVYIDVIGADGLTSSRTDSRRRVAVPGPPPFPAPFMAAAPLLSPHLPGDLRTPAALRAAAAPRPGPGCSRSAGPAAQR